jgi:lipopolysaccharide export LptBFGC system permease protein LptF
MRVLNRYLIADYLVIFFVTLVIFTFVMSLIPLLKAVDMLARDFPLKTIVSIYFFNFPYQLTFAIPVSCLTAALLLFGRLSMDGELNALRASGLHIAQIAAPVLILALGFTVICLFINHWASPKSHYNRNKAFASVEEMNPLDLIEVGQFNNQIPGIKIFIGRIEGDRIFDVEIHELDGTFLTRSIRGKHGTLTQDKAQKLLNLTLYDVNIDQRDPSDPYNETLIPAKIWEHPLDLTDIIKTRNAWKGTKDLTFRELFLGIRNVWNIWPWYAEERIPRQRLKMTLEANKRAALSVSCFCFALIGIPLGIKSKRKESSAGIMLSLIIVFTFYVFVLLAEALINYPEYRPHLIIWIPVFVSQIIGVILLFRIR